MAEPPSWTLSFLTFSILNTMAKVDGVAQSQPEVVKSRLLFRELGLLADAMTALQSHIAKLGENEDLIIIPFPVLNECKDAIIALFGSFTEDNAALLVDKAQALIAAFVQAAGPLRLMPGSYQEILYLLKSLPVGQRENLPPPPDTSLVRSAMAIALSEEIKPPPEQLYTEAHVLAWLSVLNSKDLDVEPQTYFDEEQRLRAFRDKEPEFSVAAYMLPDYAELYWKAVAPQLTSLFKASMPQSFNFVQWVLEYVRESLKTSPSDEMARREQILELTNGLCLGSITPLHVAAALGLPSLCRKIISEDGEAARCRGSIGTPLLCALAGPRILFTGSKLHKDLEDIYDVPKLPGHRAATVCALLDAGSDLRATHGLWDGQSQISLAGVAFWTSLVTCDETIFTRVVSGGAAVDEAFLNLVRDFRLPIRESFAPRTYARLILYLFELSFKPGVDVTIREAAEELMPDADETFRLAGAGRVEHIADDEFDEALRTAMVDWEDSFNLMRLAYDPRFAASIARPSHHSGGTSLHAAVSEDRCDLVELLLSKGADLAWKDSHGRTPLMVSESREMVAMLVQDYGADTTATDHDGRTLWHSCAATNCAPILEWLSQHDPCKRANLATQTKKGWTPLAEAFHYIDTLKGQLLGAAVMPDAARLLLRECYSKACITENSRLPHLAAAWGDQQLVDGLCRLKVSFNVLDEAGRSPLHHLNFSASTSLVEKLQVLCKGLPIADADGRTPADTILTNTCIRYEDDGLAYATAHPSCRTALSDDTFSKLVTSRVLTYRDTTGRDAWARFCESVKHGLHGAPRGLLLLTNSYVSAAEVLIRKGALYRYETGTHRSGLYCLRLLSEDYLTEARDQPLLQWPLVATQMIMTILGHTSDDLLKNFCASGDASNLLGEACSHGKFRLAQILCGHGVSPTQTVPTLANKTPLEVAVADADLPFTKLLLTEVHSQELFVRQEHIYDAIFTSGRSTVDKLVLLLDKGLSVNLVREERFGSPSKRASVLVEAIRMNKIEISETLLERGADPGPPSSENSAFAAAARSGNINFLGKVLAIAYPDFDWYKAYVSQAGESVHILQTEEKRENALLELCALLQRTGLSLH